MGFWLVGFFISLAGVLVASDRLVAAVEAAGDRYRWSTGLVGLLAAAGADGPEVSAAIIALAAGAHEVSLGVILGSNLFNLAAVLALPVLIVGFVKVRHSSLQADGSALLIVTCLVEAMLLRFVSAVAGLLAVAAVVAAYLYIISRKEKDVPTGALTCSDDAVSPRGDVTWEEREREREEDIRQGLPAGIVLLMRGLAATAVIIGGCDVLVNATLYLGPHLSLPSTFTGTFVLAALTSLPNVWVAMSLARRHRGAVLMSAVCNSNLINLVFGVCVPMQFSAQRLIGVQRTVDLPWLAILTSLAIALVWTREGMGRLGAGVIVALYTVFAIVRLTS